MSYLAVIRPPNHDTVYWSLVESEQEALTLQSEIELKLRGKQLRQAICDAVWNGQIDGWTTKEVAEHFQCSTTTALNILHSIADGTSGDERFKPHSAREGVAISDGRRWTAFPVDVGDRGTYSHGETLKKYYWQAD